MLSYGLIVVPQAGSASGSDDRFVAGQAMRDDVQERAEDRAEHSGEGIASMRD